MTNLLTIAIKASIKAGLEIIKIYNNDIVVNYKSDNSPLTLADKNANEIIQKHLEQTNIPIISEENKQIEYKKRKNWEMCWIVDPLDGTKEFIKKNGEFTVNIALIKNNKPILGIIYVPVTKELFVGDVSQKKSYKIIVDTDFNITGCLIDENRIFPKKNKSVIRVVASRSHLNKETKYFIEKLQNSNKNIEIVSIGSSLKFCLIAQGKADVYPRFAPTMEWDTAAGHAICDAVNVKTISQQTKSTLLYNKQNLLNPWFITNNLELNEQ